MFHQKQRELIVAALRSGEFYQAHGALKRGNSYCCLGVMCEIFRRETGKGEWITREASPLIRESDAFVIDGDLTFPSTLPPAVREWLGTESQNPVFPKDAPDGYHFRDLSLAEMNDCGGSFSTIADIIETKSEVRR